LILKLYPSNIIGWRTKTIQANSGSHLVVESGQSGWKAIDVNEIYKSACEYIGENNVYKLRIDQEMRYIPQVRNFLKQHPDVTHFFHDPRSGRPEVYQNILNSVLDSLRLAILFKGLRIVPIVYLTDSAYALWRIHAFILSSISGTIVTFLSSKEIYNRIHHHRLLGPSIMPLSSSTLRYLEEMHEELVESRQIRNIVRFTGSLYEPRTEFLNKLKFKLGDKLEILGREIGSPRIEEKEYWKLISSSTINITTSDPMNHDGNDFAGPKQMVYRYLEVLATGSMLLAPSVPGIIRYFNPGEDFIEFSDENDAYEKALFFLENPGDAELIAKSGHSKAKNLINSRTFWSQLDFSLGPESLL
jgi:hypothetical protein